MKSEQVAFGERLRAALRARGQTPSPKQISTHLPKYGGQAVTEQAVSGWLNGKSVPKLVNIKALSKMLGVDEQELHYGKPVGKATRAEAPEYKVPIADKLAIDAFLVLPESQRKAIRELIEQFSKVLAQKG